MRKKFIRERHPRLRLLRTILLLPAFLVLGALSGNAQDNTAQAKLSTNATKQLVGDQARVSLNVQHDPSLSKVVWPIIPDSFGKLELISREKIDTVKKGAITQYQQSFLVAGFDSGLFVIPSIAVQVEPNSGPAFTLHTDSLAILVQTVPVDTTKAFKGIKGIMDVKTTWRDYIWWIVGGLVLLLLLGLVWYFARKKKPELPPPPPPAEQLHLRTLRALETLERDKVWEQGDVKGYYVRLTEILRGYIEARFDVPALERTTDELVGMARRNAGLAPHSEKIYNVLFTADFAKFARAQPTPAEHVSTLQTVKEFVLATIPPTDTIDTAKTPNQS